MKALLLIAASIAIGYGLGATPVLNENLHWNLWFIIPVSGLLLGMLLGWMQFFGAYALNLNIQTGTGWALAAAATTAYLATELGIYNTMIIPVAGVEGLPDGDYRLSELFSLNDYIALTLGASSFEGRGSMDLEFGGVATKLTYAVDVIGCFAAAFVTRQMLAASYPYCVRCAQYKKRDTIFEAQMPANDETSDKFNSLFDLMTGSNYHQVVSFLKDLSLKTDKDGEVKITADQRFCANCREASIVGRVYKLDGNDWDEIDELAFQFDSQPGEHAAFG